MTTSPIHLVVTDSGVGGLSTCAAIEHRLRVAGAGSARLTYFNAWPNEGSGYNDMADRSARTATFDRALAAMAALRPDRIVIACNTLSIVYEATAYRRALADTVPQSDIRTSGRPDVRTPDLVRETSDVGPRTSDLAHSLAPVLGIVDAGVHLFHKALTATPAASIALFGTKTTIESGVHTERLLARGIDRERIVPVGCHGLAKSIETSGDGPSTAALIEQCTARAATLLAAAPGDGVVFLGVCCTHYSYISEELRLALEQRCGRKVLTLDPTDSLADHAVKLNGAESHGRPGPAPGGVTVSVVSKVRMPSDVRRMIAQRLRAIGPATAQALENYQQVPDLF